jgi:PhnB protein
MLEAGPLPHEEASMSTLHIPPGYHAVTPYLVVDDADVAIAFYAKAFGAVELSRTYRLDGSVQLAELTIEGCRVLLAEEDLAWNSLDPWRLGGNSSMLVVYVADVDTVFDRAVAEGAVVDLPLRDEAYGDRTGTVIDPSGHRWTLSQYKGAESMEQAEMA